MKHGFPRWDIPYRSLSQSFNEECRGRCPHRPLLISSNFMSHENKRTDVVICPYNLAKQKTRFKRISFFVFLDNYLKEWYTETAKQNEIAKKSYIFYFGKNAYVLFHVRFFGKWFCLATKGAMHFSCVNVRWRIFFCIALQLFCCNTNRQEENGMEFPYRFLVYKYFDTVRRREMDAEFGNQIEGNAFCKGSPSRRAVSNAD